MSKRICAVGLLSFALSTMLVAPCFADEQPIKGCIIGRVLQVEEQQTAEGCIRFIDTEVLWQQGGRQLAPHTRLASPGYTCDGSLIIHHGYGIPQPISIAVREVVLLTYSASGDTIRVCEKWTLWHPLFPRTKEGVQDFNRWINFVAWAHERGLPSPWSNFDDFEAYGGYSMDVLAEPDPPTLDDAIGEAIRSMWFLTQTYSDHEQVKSILEDSK